MREIRFNEPARVHFAGNKYLTSCVNRNANRRKRSRFLRADRRFPVEVIRVMRTETPTGSFKKTTCVSNHKRPISEEFWRGSYNHVASSERSGKPTGCAAEKKRKKSSSSSDEQLARRKSSTQSSRGFSAGFHVRSLTKVPLKEAPILTTGPHCQSPVSDEAPLRIR